MDVEEAAEVLLGRVLIVAGAQNASVRYGDVQATEVVDGCIDHRAGSCGAGDGVVVGHRLTTSGPDLGGY
jgi:hypothetical protein